MEDKGLWEEWELGQLLGIGAGGGGRRLRGRNKRGAGARGKVATCPGFTRIPPLLFEVAFPRNL